MNMSPTITKIAAALVKAQAVVKGATKDSTNPFYKSKYADLASVYDACRDALAANDIAVLQPLDNINGEGAITTILIHSSGEFISGTTPLPGLENADAQKTGSAITYMRRYALASMVVIMSEDDDGQAASYVAKPNLDDLKEKATKFSTELDAFRTKNATVTFVASNNAMLFELKQKLPAWYEKLSIKINQVQEAFDLAEQKKVG